MNKIVFHQHRVTEPPTDGVYVNGLFMEGGRWDWINGIIDEQMPKILISKVPAIHFQVNIIYIQPIL